MTRVRGRYIDGPKGTFIDYHVGIREYVGFGVSERCSDLIPGDNNHFSVERKQCSGGLLDTFTEPMQVGDCRNKQVAIMTGAWTVIDDYFPEEKPATFYASQAVARTNPSAPYVDVPVNILELGDITQLLKKQGDDLASQIAGNNLRYQFGIKPLVSDLVKLTQFHSQVARRVKQIERLKSQKGLRKTVTLDSLSKTSSSVRRLNEGIGPIFAGQVDVSSTCVIRAHTRWLPTVDMSKMPPLELTRLAQRAVLGLTVDFSTLWEAVPFSWLIDWGYNVGDFLKAKRNIIPAALSDLSLMRHAKTQYTIPEVYGNNYHSGAGLILHETKNRGKVPLVIPGAHFPFLSENQMGILASLAVTRR